MRSRDGEGESPLRPPRSALSDPSVSVVIQEKTDPGRLPLHSGPSPVLKERFHHGRPETLLGEEVRQHDVLHWAVVGATEARPEEVTLCLLVFSQSWEGCALLRSPR